ncbi:MAG: hypothetical protein JSV91_06490 [Phycisphaerales bacterium]|nr:MAG: hypothetical protein JSV91_06490 [Phycisphaerales bacterium]
MKRIHKTLISILVLILLACFLALLPASADDVPTWESAPHWLPCYEPGDEAVRRYVELEDCDGWLWYMPVEEVDRWWDCYMSTCWPWPGAYPGNPLWVEVESVWGYCFKARFLGDWQPFPFGAYRFIWSDVCLTDAEVGADLVFAGPACDWDCENGVEGSMWISFEYDCQ